MTLPHLDLIVGNRWILRLVASALAVLLAQLPLRRSAILFTSYPDASGNALAMFRYLNRILPDREFGWLVQDPALIAPGTLDGAHLIKRRSLRGLIAFATSKIVFHTHGIFHFAPDRSDQTVVNLWHGMPLKTIGTYDQANRALPRGDYAIATSDMFAKVIATAFAMPLSRVLVTGQPATDPLVTASKAAPDIALWMPTYRKSVVGDVRDDSTFSPSAFLELLDQLDGKLAERGARVVLKLHPMDALNSMIPEHYKAIEVIGGEDRRQTVEELMARARCLVTDYSSAAIDYAVLDRPIGYFCPDRAAYSRGFIPEVEQAFFAAGTMLNDADQLAEFFARPSGNPGDGVAMLAAFKDARSSERLWNALKAAGAT